MSGLDIFVCQSLVPDRQCSLRSTYQRLGRLSSQKVKHLPSRRGRRKQQGRRVGSLWDNASMLLGRCCIDTRRLTSLYIPRIYIKRRVKNSWSHGVTETSEDVFIPLDWLCDIFFSIIDSSAPANHGRGY